MSRAATTVQLLAAACLAAVLGPSAAAQTPRADGEAVLALCRQHCRSFDLVHGNSMYYGGSVEEARQALATLEQLEREVLPEVQPVLAHIVETYGSTAMEVNNAFHRLGVSFDDNVGNRFDELYRGVANVRSSRAASAEQILQRARMDTGNMGFYSPEIKVRKMRQAKELLVVARQLDPANDGVNRMLASIDGDIETLESAAEAEIDAARWAGDIASFSGPGSPDGLAATALAFFRGHANWGGSSDRRVDVLRVAVRGDWSAAETDLFGRIVSWRLPVHVAVRTPELAERSLVRVYELSAVTRRGGPGTAPSPPFDRYWVGRSWLMRAGRL